MKTFYEILGVPRDSERGAIKQAYRKLVKLYHPDINKDGERAFEEITQAYNTLIDPEKRAEYEEKLKTRGKAPERSVKPRFGFREFKTWLFSLNFLKTLFGQKKVSNPYAGIDKSVTSLDVKELLQRVIYSTNVYVQINAVRAVFAKKKKYAANDLLRILHSNIAEEVKLEILRGIQYFRSARVMTTLREILNLEKSLRVRTAIQSVLRAAA
ncbi:MAG: DnaJ domain-containing protein [Brevinematales bacterium]|nr:DnaJ domain-containing protein [Brevinematales bacterium]